MATIRDVARLAGVSIATVSNVLNDPARVKPTLQCRVMQAVKALGCAPIRRREVCENVQPT
jgi:LacI family transcriptional regulator